MSRLLFRALGLISVGIGALGTIVPLLPTTPFILLGAMCFARGSAKLHAWLLTHRVFGPLIKNWQFERSITLRAKATALIGMALAIGITVVLAVPPTVLLVQGIVLSAVAAFIVSRPTPSCQNESVQQGVSLEHKSAMRK